jgi:hypothetical protein
MKTKTIFKIVNTVVPLAAVVIGIFLGTMFTSSLDKQGAAEQFSVEISSMNNTLQIYASEYFQNQDLECNQANVKITPNKTNFLMLDSTPPFEIVYNNDSVAAYQGYPHPQVQSGPGYVIGYSFPNGPTPTFGNECSIYYLIIPPPLYNDHGMYYTYVKNVPEFDPDLAKKLDIFYNDITSAESDRVSIQNHLDSINSPILQELQTSALKDQYLSAYMDMRMKIINASELEPGLLQELDKQSQESFIGDITSSLQPPTQSLSSTGCRLNLTEHLPSVPVSFH